MSKKNKLKAVLVSIAAVLTLLFSLFVKFYGDYLEITEIGGQFLSVYFKDLVTGAVIYLVSALVMFLIIFIQIFIARKCLEKEGVKQPLLERNRIVLPLSIILSLFTALFLNNELSSDFLLFANAQNFNLSDPLFFKDVGFYVFSRPFVQMCCESLTYLWSIMFVVIVIVYITSYFKFGERTIIDLAKCKPIVNHLAVNVVIFMLIKAFDVTLSAYDLLFSKFSEYTGAGFVDSVVWVNYYKFAPFLMIIITLLVIVFVKKNKIKPALISFASYFAIYLMTGIIAFAVDGIYVSPNESKVEEQYIKNHIEYTKKAYNIDNVTESEYKINNSFKADDINSFNTTIDNIRIVDIDATLTATNQIQGLRSYYDFKDLDIAVYNIKGKEKAVILGVRELDKTKMDGQVSSYINDKFRYTHGFGAIMSSINTVTSQGEPEYIIKDLTQTENEGIPVIKQPRVYYGETDNNTVIVNSKVREIDYSEGDVDFEFDYDGKAGIKLSFLNKLVMAFKTGDMKLLVSNQVTSNSRMLVNKNIIDRVTTVAPFLSVDNDPHIVITDDGKLVWVIDAYTTTDKFPYSQSYEGQFNYIRNSVKITVDAYDGTTKFYIIDKNDPIVNVYSNIYPQLFEKEELPDDIFSKTKYPENLFTIQSKMYQRYHTNSPVTFYNKSDMYKVASEKYNNEIREMKPYYNIMQLEEFNTDNPEMIFMLPYTLYNRENMVAWIAAGNSRENYGKLVCYKYPKNYNIYGPLQIENMIDNDSEISKELTLWNSGGSTVIRGNILVIPIMGSILYIEPVYINAENQASIPVLKRMIAVFGDNIAMEENLQTALKKVFTKDLTAVYKEIEAGTIEEDAPDIAVGVDNETLNKIAQAYSKIETSAKDGDWETFGKGMDELKQIISEFTPETTIEEDALKEKTE